MKHLERKNFFKDSASLYLKQISAPIPIELLVSLNAYTLNSL